MNYRVPGHGKKTFKNFIYSGILIEPNFIPLIVDGKEPETAWEIDLQPVVVQRSRIVRARPRFDDWDLEFRVSIVDPMIRPANVREFIEAAGRYHGLCDFRPLYGLFEVIQFDIQDD